MKRYRFPLQGVLSWTETREREAQREADEARQIFARESAALEAIEGEIATVHRELERNTDPRRSVHLLGALDATVGRAHAQSQIVAQARETYSVRQAAAVEAARERKKLERLEERRRAEHESEAARRAAIEADELTTTRFVHRRRHAD